MDSANKRLGVGARITEILVREASFAALKEILTGNDFTRTRPYKASSPWQAAEKARAEGPSLTQAFHERASTKTSHTRPIMHDVVAMANTEGGTIYVGVNPDMQVTVHGVERPEEAVRMLKSDLQRSIEPPLDVEFEVLPSHDRGIIVIRVPEGDAPPYVYTPTCQVYVRNERRTDLAHRDDIISLVRKSLGAEVLPRETRRTSTSAESLPTPRPQPEWVEERPAPVPTTPQQERRDRDRWREPAARQEPPQETRRLGELSTAPPERPRSPLLANLPPEKIKGQIRPMVDWGAAAAGEDAELRDAERESPLVMERLEEIEEVVEEVPAIDVTTIEGEGRGRRSRRRSRASEAQPHLVPEAQPESVAGAAPVEETPPAKPSRSRSRRRKPR
jgi:hypothetical protein